MTRPFRHLPWLRSPAWHSTRPPPAKREYAETDFEPIPKEWGELMGQDTPVPRMAVAYIFSIITLAAATLFGLAWLGKLP